jgi:hypothetical protein
MGDADNPHDDGASSGHDAATVAPDANRTNPPSEQEIAEQHNRQVDKNIDRFFYQPIKWTITRIDKYSDAVIAAATVIIMLATVVNVVYVGGQLSEMQSGSSQTDKLIQSNADLAAAAKTQAKTASDAFIANGRAWIGPSRGLADVSSIGKYTRVEIYFSNSGHEPSSNLVVVKPRIATRDQWEHGAAVNQMLFDYQQCFQTKSYDKGAVAFPGAIYTFTLDGNSTGPDESKIKITQELINGDSIFYVDVCFIYFTLGTVKHSSSCFYYDKNAGTSASGLGFCSEGNHAE